MMCLLALGRVRFKALNYNKLKKNLAAKVAKSAKKNVL